MIGAGFNNIIAFFTLLSSKVLNSSVIFRRSEAMLLYSATSFLKACSFSWSSRVSRSSASLSTYNRGQKGREDKILKMIMLTQYWYSNDFTWLRKQLDAGLHLLRRGTACAVSTIDVEGLLLDHVAFHCKSALINLLNFPLIHVSIRICADGLRYRIERGW